MYEGKKLFTRFQLGIPLRIGLALFAVFTSIAVALVLIVGSQKVDAAPTFKIVAAHGTDPWGISFDGRGYAWVAEPGCDPNPVCGSVITGSIDQVNRSNFGVVNHFVEPAGYSSPLFTAVDGAGNIWFTEPMSNAIGELIPNLSNPSASTWHQWAAPTASASPFDLTFDSHGNLWFTEVNANKIGEFSGGTITETPTPTGSSKPYGIVGPDPTSGQIWFTENNTAVAKIGSFTPPASGSLAAGNINEYNTVNPGNSATPHLITYDHSGNIWWTEGPNGRIGRLAINQAASGTSNGVTEFKDPAPCLTSEASCRIHFSGIGVDGSGTVWFDNSQDDGIISYVPGSNTFTTYMADPGNTNAHPHDGFAIDGSNTLYFSEEFANSIGQGVQIGVPTPPPGTTPTVITGSPTATPAPPSTPPGPVNKTWYFAEGRVGRGFREYITIDNPNSVACAVDLQYLYTPDGGTPQTQTVSALSVPAASRVTEPVNADLGLDASSQAAAIVATVVKVSASAAACPGVVAERPLYFSGYHGLNGGTDVVGATHLNTSFYFADVPNDAKNSSYLTILNPPGGSSASVTATYYSGGQQVGTQSATVPAGARGTITPALATPALPAHSAVVITSTQPVFLERPTYFTGANDNGISISGGYDVTGAAKLANDWLFAEGYTNSNPATGGPIMQEYLTIANTDPANASAAVTIVLKSKTGATQSFPVTVGAQSQLVWNVNANNTFSGSSPEVSAEVKSTGANIVVQRELYFSYNHTTSDGQALHAQGGTDVVGQVASGAYTSYSFAEGYSKTGYNEWLTVQNPTGSTETIYITMVNGYGRNKTLSFQVAANSRFTLDISSAVLQNLVQSGDDHRGYEVSMTVQTLNNGGAFLAERPMYWNTSGYVTQGGSDVIGYVGN